MATTGYCCFNSMIECGERKCRTCGWNPAVQEIRLVEWCRRRAEQKK